jgi:hypothetical protein
MPRGITLVKCHACEGKIDNAGYNVSVGFGVRRGSRWQIGWTWDRSLVPAR